MFDPTLSGIASAAEDSSHAAASAVVDVGGGPRGVAASAVSGITVIGVGREGIVHAVSLASLGFRVLAVDFDRELVRALTLAHLPFPDADLADQLRAVLATGNLRFTTDFDEAAGFGTVHFICLPNCEAGEVGRAKAVELALTELAGRLTVRSLIVGKLTAPLGTATHLADILSVAARPGVEIELAWNPDSIDAGWSVAEVTHPDRLLFGVESVWAEHKLREVFAPMLAEGTLLIVADIATTELVHAAATALTSTRISYLDDAGELCTVTRAEIDGMASVFPFGNWLSSRLSGQPREKPSLKTAPLIEESSTAAIESPQNGGDRTIGDRNGVDRINVDRISGRRRLRTLGLIRDIAGGSLEGVRVSAVGGPSATVGSAAATLDLAQALSAEGAIVTMFAPITAEAWRRRYPQLNCADSLAAAVMGADVLVLVTEWHEFARADPDDLGQLVRTRCIVDAQGVLDEDEFRSRGWEYRAPGRTPRPRTVDSSADPRDDWLLPA